MRFTFLETHISLVYLSIIIFVNGKPPLRIIGGRDATNDEYPYVVRIESQTPVSNDSNINKSIISRHICTGSVISPYWTISSAHCFASLDSTQINNSRRVHSLILRTNTQLTIVIRYGSVFATPLENNTFSTVDYYILHHSFQMQFLPYLKEGKGSNDVALVHHQPISMKQYAKVSGIDITSLVGHEVILAGYGATDYTDGKLYDTLNLQKPLQVMSGVVTRCPFNPLVYPAYCVSRLCTQSGMTDNGDSGGPVLHSTGIVGLITNKRNLFLDNPVFTAVIFTALSPYLQWISDHVREDH